MKGAEALTTQCYIRGHPMNERDGIFLSLRDPRAAAALQADFAPLPGSRIGELEARFDIVLGRTAEL